MVAAGALLLLGTSAAQAFGEEAAYIPTTVMTLEGVAGLLGAVVAPQRALAVAGSAGVALGVLRALIGLLSLAPLFVVFGGVALMLLVPAASLAVLRERFTAARSAVAAGWADWA